MSLSTFRIFLVALFFASQPLASEALASHANDSFGAEEALKLVESELNARGVQNAKLMVVTDESIDVAFPSQTFVSVHFMEWPVARVAPEGFSTRNIYVVASQGTLTLLPNADSFEGYARNALVPVLHETTARHALRAWLMLSQEYSQDLYFHFTLDEQSIAVSLLANGPEVTGRVNVVKEIGNDGFFSVTLRFAYDGFLQEVKETRKVQAGMRPICQATKLLDVDPLVRRMAERDLLVMGHAAESYLQMQVKDAKPDLKEAILRIRERIAQGDRGVRE